MKKLNFLLTIFISTIILSCSSDNNNNEENNTQNFIPKLLKKITDNDGYWNKYFYDENNKLILITRTSNGISLDSTYYEYNNDKLSKTLNRVYSGNLIVNVETVFNDFNLSGSDGTYKVFLDDGTIWQEKTFEFTFSNNIIKSIKYFNLDGTKSQEKTYTHNENGNLNSWTSIWYSTNNTIDTIKEYTFSEWDTNGLKTESLFFWDYDIRLPNIYISNSNCLNRIENNQVYSYSFEYDTDGNVTQYNLIDEQKNFTLEYY